MSPAQPVTLRPSETILDIQKSVLGGKHLATRIVRFDLAGHYVGILGEYGYLEMRTGLRPHHFESNWMGRV